MIFETQLVNQANCLKSSRSRVFVGGGNEDKMVANRRTCGEVLEIVVTATDA